MKASVNKILKADLTKDYGFAVTYVDEEQVTHSFNVFTDTQFRQIVKQMFGAREYNDWDDESFIAGLVTDFQASFDAWKAIRQDTYGRRMFALDVKFNPLENYRSHEEREGSFTHGESVELSFDERKEKITDDSYVERTHTDLKETTKDDSFVERTHTNLKETTTDDSYVEHSYSNNYEETYGYGQQTHTHKVSADDSADFSNASEDIDSAHDDTKSIEGTTKDQNGQIQNGHVVETSGSYKDQHGQTLTGHVVETSGSYRDTHGYTNGLNREQLGKETTTHSGEDQDSYTLERYGNIGVTTSQQMLASDLDLLKYDISMTAIKEFIQQYTYISCEVD